MQIYQLFHENYFVHNAIIEQIKKSKMGQAYLRSLESISTLFSAAHIPNTLSIQSLYDESSVECETRELRAPREWLFQQSPAKSK